MNLQMSLSIKPDAENPLPLKSAYRLTDSLTQTFKQGVWSC
jgi:hypothetical protein